MHLNFGWDGIGYHKIIRRDGTLENGRPEFWVGAHTYGLNEKSQAKEFKSELIVRESLKNLIN